MAASSFSRNSFQNLLLAASKPPSSFFAIPFFSIPVQQVPPDPDPSPQIHRSTSQIQTSTASSQLPLSAGAAPVSSSLPASPCLEPPALDPTPNNPISSIPSTPASRPPLPSHLSSDAAQQPAAWSKLFKSKPSNAGQFVPRDFPLVYHGSAIVPPKEVIHAGAGVPVLPDLFKPKRHG